MFLSFKGRLRENYSTRVKPFSSSRIWQFHDSSCRAADCSSRSSGEGSYVDLERLIGDSKWSSSSSSSKMGVARFRVHMSSSSSETPTDRKIDWGWAVTVLSIGRSAFRVGEGGNNGADTDLRIGFRGCLVDWIFRTFVSRSTKVKAVMVDEFVWRVVIRAKNNFVRVWVIGLRWMKRRWLVCCVKTSHSKTRQSWEKAIFDFLARKVLLVYSNIQNDYEATDLRDSLPRDWGRAYFRWASQPLTVLNQTE